jgi:aspartyl-tRNA(Asn)/glutamyl-tRNA(Gln) amidotransferase subunit A
VLPLSPSLDSVGPLAASVGGCAIVDAVLAGTPPAPPMPATLSGRRLAVPDSLLADGVAPEVAAAFARALARLEGAGARLIRLPVPEFDEVFAATGAGGLTAPESYAWHRRLLAENGALYDPAIRARIERGAAMSAADYLDVLAARRRLIAAFDRRTDGFDAMVLPTAPILPAPIAALDSKTEYNRVNMLTLRHTTLANFLDRCAISLPCHRPGDPPVGLMLMGDTMGDAWLFAIAAAAEAALATETGRP